MWWVGDVNVRLKLNTPLMLRWAWGGVGGVGWGCERSFAVEHATDARLSMGWGGDVNARLKLNTPVCVLTCWKKTAQVYMHNDHWNWQGKKRSGFRVEGLPNARKMTFFLRFLLWDGYETLKGLSFFDHGDAPIRAIPHPAGYICINYIIYIIIYIYTYSIFVYVHYL